MHTVLQALGQSHPAYASTDPAEHNGGKRVHMGSIIKMSICNFPSVAWIT